MIHSKLLIPLALVLLAQAYQNCGGARQFSAMDSYNSEASVTAAPEVNALSNEALEDDDKSANLSTITTSYDYYLAFGAIADSMVAPLESAVGKYVRNSNCSKVPDDQYRCGEIPTGDILDNNRKLLTTMDLGSSFEGKKGKQSYKFHPKKGDKVLMRIYLDRHQRRGSQTLFYLPSQRKESVETSAKLGENIFFTLQPRGSFFDSQICTVIPGLDIELDEIALSGEVRKSDALPFGIDAKAKGDVIIHPGQMSFGNAYVCGILRVTFKNGVPFITIEDLSDIRFQEASYKGLRVEKKIKVSGLLGFFDGLFNLGIEGKFKSAIQSEVTKLVNREVRLTSAQIKNGTYLKEYLDKAKLAPYVEKLNEQIQKGFAENGFISEQADRISQAACVSTFASLELEDQALADLTRICSFSPKIKIKSMYGAKESPADCYKGFFDPRAENSLGGTDWWKASCKVILRTEVTLQNDLLPAISCLTEALKLNRLPSATCRDVFINLHERYTNGEFRALIQSVASRELTEAQIQEIQTLLKTQLNTKNLSLSLLKKIFQ